MSYDTTDDLHAAEDYIAAAETWIRRLEDRLGDHWWTSTFCRPSCGAEGPRDRCESEEPDWCGCPCHDHYNEDEALTCHTCGRIGNREDGIEPGGPCQEPCEGTVVRVDEGVQR